MKYPYDTQQPGQVVDTAVPETVTRIGGKTYDTQQPDEVVATSPMGARYPIENSPKTRAPGQIFDEVRKLNDPDSGSIQDKYRTQREAIILWSKD